MCTYIRTYVHTCIPFERLMDKIPLRYSVWFFLFHWTCDKKKKDVYKPRLLHEWIRNGRPERLLGHFSRHDARKRCASSEWDSMCTYVYVMLFFSLLSCTKIHSNTSLSLSLSLSLCLCLCLSLFLSLFFSLLNTHAQTTNTQVYVEHHALHFPHQCHASRHSQSLA